MTKKHPTPAVNSLTLEQAHELIYKLLDRITELEDRLNQHSGNSSKPPSSDGPGSVPPARQRPASGKKRGAQPGHKGQRREHHPHDARLSVVSYYPPADCPCCGGKVLAHDKPYRVHQVFDLPEVSYFVTEHQLFRARHSYEDGDLDKERYLRRLSRYRQSWLTQLEQGVMVCTKRYRGRCEWLIKDDEMLWRFISDDDIPLTSNEAERALRGYVLWRKGSYGVCSHRGELFRQRILSLVETAKRLGRCPEEWLRAVVRACIEKTDYPIPVELCASSPCR